ncbi:MAG: hypothetical protein NVSMB62_24600 [Acidobacteriaceae bacterium]
MGYEGYGQGRAAVAEQGAVRTVVVASSDVEMRRRAAEELRAMRWNVREAAGGAEAIALLDVAAAEALLLDHWLPDLQVEELAGVMRSLHPEMDILRADGGSDLAAVRSPRRTELLAALRKWQGDADPEAVEQSPRVLCGLESVVYEESVEREAAPAKAPVSGSPQDVLVARVPVMSGTAAAVPAGSVPETAVTYRKHAGVAALPLMVGDSEAMLELAWLIRLVSPRTTPVLIEGATGTGKELVAKAVHRLSARASKPFVVLNCAAIPESLLEAELFGHTRGAFTGAVQSRVGRVEAANGGTLFLDEIGEMPIALQAKMLRFLECGEIQRVGGNETMRVDVRIVAATHQPLKQRAGENAFRLDLYHRLAVFPVHVPSLVERKGDIPALARCFLDRLGEEMPVKRLSPSAERMLMAYEWPGNVRELAHVLERATILAEDRLEITPDEVRF